MPILMQDEDDGPLPSTQLNQQNIKRNMNKGANENYVKKNYLDPTAVFIYQLGCSLVHFAMLAGSLIC
jgi:hypothetical protein